MFSIRDAKKAKDNERRIEALEAALASLQEQLTELVDRLPKKRGRKRAEKTD